ncbi:carboxymuconolactone decarboxylase family protein [Salinimicrobium sp. HB62]|uniref:carboxymuconolactone decarboxylase family protein n=1 Tax=Salinimicrobium sp. HB62 TaxID=3077781 RepID=UPI002D76B9A0|nr:carboxymuconolactone decarboxylase family protein [Salinimicrobium sp. HB62]
MNTRIELSEVGASAFEKLLGHNSAILENWNQLEVALFESSGLESELLEQVRRTLAYGNACEYCMAKAGPPSFDARDQRISLATAFAELFALDHKSIVAAHFSALKEVFDTREISALCAFISFLTASQRFGRVMNLTSDLQKVTPQV